MKRSHTLERAAGNVGRNVCNRNLFQSVIIRPAGTAGVPEQIYHSFVGFIGNIRARTHKRKHYAFKRGGAAGKRAFAHPLHAVGYAQSLHGRAAGKGVFRHFRHGHAVVLFGNHHVHPCVTFRCGNGVAVVHAGIFEHTFVHGGKTHSVLRRYYRIRAVKVALFIRPAAYRGILLFG